MRMICSINHSAIANAFVSPERVFLPAEDQSRACNWGPTKRLFVPCWLVSINGYFTRVCREHEQRMAAARVLHTQAGKERSCRWAGWCPAVLEESRAPQTAPALTGVYAPRWFQVSVPGLSRRALGAQRPQPRALPGKQRDRVCLLSLLLAKLNYYPHNDILKVKSKHI